MRLADGTRPRRQLPGGGLANNAFFLILFVGARLYADASLQVVYLGLGVFGWWAWLRAGPRRTKLATTCTAPWMLAACAAATVAMTLVLLPILRDAHDVAPFLDALTTALSLTAQTLLNLKKIENWWVWMAADGIYLPLYFSKHLYLTGVVYALFFGLCIVGWRHWRHAAPTRPSPVALATA